MDESLKEKAVSLETRLQILEQKTPSFGGKTEFLKKMLAFFKDNAILRSVERVSKFLGFGSESDEAINSLKGLKKDVQGFGEEIRALEEDAQCFAQKIRAIGGDSQYLEEQTQLSRKAG